LFTPPLTDVTSQTLNLEGEYVGQLEFSKVFRVNATLWGQSDFLEKSETSKEQFAVDELTLSYQKIARRLKLGYSYRSWEGTDVINPMNLLSSDNYRDPMHSRKQSGYGVFYDDAIGNWEWDATYLFQQSTPLLPEEESPWWPRNLYLPTESDQLSLQIPENMRYRILDREVLDHAFENNWALRIQHHFDDFDLAVGAMEGLSPLPILSPLVNVAPIQIYPKEIYRLQSPIEIKPIFYRQRAVAGKLVWTLGDTIIRFSTNHVQPLGDDTRLPGWSDLYVIALERSFYFSGQMLTLLAQYMDSRRPDAQGLSILTSLYEKSYFTGLRWAPNENWTVMLAFFQETKFHSYFFRPEINWRFEENWNLGLEGYFFEGSEESGLGTYNKNDAGYISLKRSF